jgi:hypothetical protein
MKQCGDQIGRFLQCVVDVETSKVSFLKNADIKKAGHCPAFKSLGIFIIFRQLL